MMGLFLNGNIVNCGFLLRVFVDNVRQWLFKVSFCH